MIKKVLICGGIGAGKSTICKMFEELGVPVFYSDEAARNIMDNNAAIIHHVKKMFGKDIYKDGVLDRKRLADIVFNDKDKLKKLDNLVHPAVGEAFKSFCWKYENTLDFPDVHYVIEEAAIGIELGIQDNFDEIILVTADEEERIERVMKRDNCSRQKVIDRMNNQLSDEEKKEYADHVIINNQFPNAKCHVNRIHRNIVEEVKNKM